MDFNFGIFEAPEDLIVDRQTTRLFMGRPVEFAGTFFDGTKIPARITIGEGKVSRVAHVTTHATAPDLPAGEYIEKHTMETTIRRINMGLEVAGDDGKMIPIQRAIYDYGRSKGLNLDYDTFVERLRHSFGMPFGDTAEWFMTTRHPGANPESYEPAAALLEAAGATRRSTGPADHPNQTTPVWRDSCGFGTGTADGLPLTGFEVGQIDRRHIAEVAKDSMAPGGFQDFVDAICTMFVVKLSLFEARKARKAEMEAGQDVEAQHTQLNTVLRGLNGANLGGARVQLTRIDDDETTNLAQVPNSYTNDSVPVGRLHGEGWDMDFWKRRDSSTIEESTEGPSEGGTTSTVEAPPDPWA